MVKKMIAIYVRVSTIEQAENGHSITEQIDRLCKFCDALNLGKPKVYNDSGYSGANTDRPALQLLISDVKAKKINKVIVYKLDRLSRSQKDTLMLIEDIFLSNGCDFVSMSENFDTSTPLGKAMIGVLAVFAQLEREQIKERMSMGREARAKQGKYAGSWRLPLGYDYIDGELVPNDFEKVMIQKIFSDYASGKAPVTIARELNSKGMTHKYGRWQTEVIRSILRRKTYIGYVHFNGEWYQGTHKPIVSEELFEKVQKRLDKVGKDFKEHNSRPGKALSYLGGLVYCKRCGAKYFKNCRHSKQYAYDYYCCYNRYPHDGAGTCKNDNWRMEELDKLIFDEIKKLSFESSAPSNLPDNTDIINDRINELNKQIERLMNLYTLDEVPFDVLQKKIHSISEQKAKLEKSLTVEPNTISEEEAEEIVTSFDDILSTEDIDTIRTAITSLINRIEIDGENVYIYWNIS